MKDLYAVMGVAPFAGANIVETAYRSLLAGTGMTDERRQEIEQAYKVLSDSATRSIYDQALRAGAGAPEDLPAAESGLLEAAKGRAMNLLRHNRSIAAVVALVIALPIAASMLISARMDKEREQLRLQREREIQLRAQQADAEARERQAQTEADREADQRRREIEDLERKNKYDSERALRDAQNWRQNQVDQELAERQRKAEERERARREEEELRQRNEEEAKRRLEQYQQIIRGGAPSDDGASR
jgi:curved DNA-binding protein CbpA